MIINRIMFVRVIIALLSIATILSGCGNTGSGSKAAETVSPSKEPTAAAIPTPVSREKWVHGVLTAKGDAGFQQMAVEKGFFDKLGIDIKIQEFESDSTLSKALIAGQIDSMEATPAGILTAISQGADLKFVGATIPGLSHVLFTKNEIKTVKDLKGKVVGISGPGALPQVIAQGLLLKEGMGLNDVTWANAGGDAARFKALVTGKVDAVVSSIDFKTMADEDPGVHYIADVADVLPNYLRFTFIVSGKTTQSRGDALTRVLQAEAEGLRYAIEHREETLQLSSKITGIDKADPSLALVYDTHVNKKLLAPNLKFDPAALQWMYELNKQLGKNNKEFNVTDYIDLKFAEKAIANIGEYTWKSK